MLEFLAPLLPFAANAVGSFFSSKGQKEVNSANAQMSRDQMNFQERMSSTAWQRAVKDMRAAGINPGLAYSQGGASSPQGAMAQLSNPYESVHSAASNSADSYRQNQLLLSQLEVNKSLARMQESQRSLNDANSARVLADMPSLKLKNNAVGLGLSAAKDIKESGLFTAAKNAFKWIFKKR